MARLYRSASYPQHWLVWSDDFGWARFPARINGWEEQCPMRSVPREQLQPLPLRLAFNTGLLESLQRRGLDRAA
jgi:hypothetical protein